MCKSIKYINRVRGDRRTLDLMGIEGNELVIGGNKDTVRSSMVKCNERKNKEHTYVGLRERTHIRWIEGKNKEHTYVGLRERTHIRWIEGENTYVGLRGKHTD